MSVHGLAKAYNFTHALAYASKNFRIRKCTNLLFNGFPLINFLQLVYIEKCPFCNICLECTYDTNQKYLKRYLIYFLNTFLKRYFLIVTYYVLHTQPRTSISWTKENKSWRIPGKTSACWFVTPIHASFWNCSLHKLKKAPFWGTGNAAPKMELSLKIFHSC